MNTETTQTPDDDDDAMIEIMDHSVDTEARDNGTWIKRNAIIPGLVFQARGFDSPKLMALEIALQKERPDGYGEDDQITLDRNMYENRRKCQLGIVGFKPFTHRGERVTFSRETLKRYLHDRSFDKFLYAAINAMKQADNVTIKWRDAAEKNSGAGSEENSASESAPAA